ncbi:RHO1 GDP-GTP exchange protein 2 [Linnemannia gamsii]|uniref:RHO1 GDP-GTP exchange protein 2 n=1 Tax=Linnemannia gamsii TaxID=64522 RepID=A0ABQ7K6D2_9FUNG|nr:RHO1 GDP-GTP exchange protein 2 [Linnemannia gamsii]
MANYSTPPTSQGQSTRSNPLVPVTYTPQSTYVPSPKSERNKSIHHPNPNSPYRHSNNSNLSHSNAALDEPSPSSAQYPTSPLQYQHSSQHQPDHHPSPLQHHSSYQQQQQQQQQGFSRRPSDAQSIMSSNGSIRESPSQRIMAQQQQQQQHFNPTLGKLAQVNENDASEPRQSFQFNIRNQDGSMADIQQDVSSLNISSPPRLRPHDNNVNSTPQQRPPNAFNPFRSSQQQQNQNYSSYEHQQQQQQQQQQAHPYNDSHAYPQPSPTPSTASKLYRTSTGSSTTHTSWSQPSSPGFPPQSFNGQLQESVESGEPVYISEAARLLFDFNPSVLSTIAVAFREKMLQNESKRLESVNYDLEFPCTFTGKETVDVIVELTRVEDRRHALAIARSLEEQQLFFGGGTLYDSNNDLYFFTEHTLAFIPGKSEFPAVPVGVFPHSSRCYSYDCQPSRPPCYSYLCPNRQSISSMLGRTNSDMSTVTSTQEKVWANSVSPSVVAAASKKERNRQEAIFEVIHTEANYIRDLELLQEIFINPLMAGNIVSPDKLETLIDDVFLNFKEILELNKLLLADLRVRQEQQPLVESIGDVFLPHIAGFEQAYSRYIPRIALSEFAYKKEAAQNPTFKAFLDNCTRHPEARRLGLRHFIGQPYQRIPRYPLLLSEVVKRTEEDVPDRATVQDVIKACTELGKRVDSCMPEGNRQLRLLNIQDKIFWKTGEAQQDLKLSEKGRKFHFEALVKRRSNLDFQMIELRVFLFDHMLVMTKEKRDKQGEKEDMLYQVSKKVIPLELVQVWADDGKPVPIMNGRGDAVPGRKLNNSTKSTGSGHRHSAFIAPHEIRVGFQETKYVAPVTIEHRGRWGGIYTIFMTLSERDTFLEQVEIAQARRQEAVSGSHLFKMQVITHYNAAPPLPSSNLVHNPMDGRRSTCSTPYLNVLDGKRRVVIGTEEGVYVGMEDDPFSFRLALREQSVSQVSVLESYHMLLVLTGKVLKAFNLSCLDPNSDKSLQVGQQLGKSVQFFSAGTCAGKTLVITMKKKNGGESHFSAYEPVENAVLGGQHRGGFSLSSFKSSKSDWFKLYREFYVGTDSSQLQMLAKMVCVVCPKGFEIVILENLNNTQEFPNRHDEAFSFLEARPGSFPISMFKINADEFLMCYTDFAFTMTKKGELAKKELIEWEGRPESFALAPPYIIAFEPGLIEVRHIETGALEQIILGNNIRRLYSNVEIKKEPTNSVIQLVMSDPNNPESRQVVKMLRVAHPIKQPIEYQPKSPYIPNNGRLSFQQPQQQQQQMPSPTPSHLMSPALQPVLSINGSGPAVLATHTHHYQQQQYHQHTSHHHHQRTSSLSNNHINGSNDHHHHNSNGGSHPVQHFNPHQYQQTAPPPIPTRPSSHHQQQQQIFPSYPVHPYEPPTQPYPMVMVDRKESNGGSGGAGHHQQQQQQHQQQHQQQQQQGGSGHAISWSSGGYP